MEASVSLAPAVASISTLASSLHQRHDLHEGHDREVLAHHVCDRLLQVRADRDRVILLVDDE